MADGALARARAAGVERVLVPGVDAAQLERAGALTSDGLSFAVGVHPCFEGDAGALAAWVDRLGAVAIGELGWHRGRAPDEALVDAQLDLARSRELPVILHVVGMHGHALERLQKHGTLRGVVHAYSGSAELVERYVRLGLSISIGPSVLDERAKKVHAAARAVPADRLLVETDAPDQIAEPADVARVGAEVAALRGEPVDAIAEQTFRNAEALFGGGR